MAFRQIWQNDSDDIVLPNAERMESVGRLGDAAQEFGVGPALGLRETVGGQKERNRRRVGIDRRAATDQVVSALGHGLERAGGLDFANVARVWRRVSPAFLHDHVALVAQIDAAGRVGDPRFDDVADLQILRALRLLS